MSELNADDLDRWITRENPSCQDTDDDCHAELAAAQLRIMALEQGLLNLLEALDHGKPDEPEDAIEAAWALMKPDSVEFTTDQDLEF